LDVFGVPTAATTLFKCRMMINAATNTIIKKATEPATIPANAPVERPPLLSSPSSADIVGLTLGIVEGKYFRTA
jgi:hypothetical protein